jgi:hypothetical protein
MTEKTPGGKRSIEEQTMQCRKANAEAQILNISGLTPPGPIPCSCLAQTMHSQHHTQQTEEIQKRWFTISKFRSWIRWHPRSSRIRPIHKIREKITNLLKDPEIFFFFLKSTHLKKLLESVLIF